MKRHVTVGVWQQHKLAAVFNKYVSQYSHASLYNVVVRVHEMELRLLSVNQLCQDTLIHGKRQTS